MRVRVPPPAPLFSVHVNVLVPGRPLRGVAPPTCSSGSRTSTGGPLLGGTVLQRSFQRSAARAPLAAVRSLVLVPFPFVAVPASAVPMIQPTHHPAPVPAQSSARLTQPPPA